MLAHGFRPHYSQASSNAQSDSVVYTITGVRTSSASQDATEAQQSVKLAEQLVETAVSCRRQQCILHSTRVASLILVITGGRAAATPLHVAATQQRRAQNGHAERVQPDAAAHSHALGVLALVCSSHTLRFSPATSPSKRGGLLARARASRHARHMQPGRNSHTTSQCQPERKGSTYRRRVEGGRDGMGRVLE